MADEPLMSRIEALVQEEHALMNREQSDDDETLAQDRDRLQAVSVELDRCWDLLRQRRARREAGENPDEAQVRDASTVENYWQ